MKTTAGVSLPHTRNIKGEIKKGRFLVRGDLREKLFEFIYICLFVRGILFLREMIRWQAAYL